MVQTIDYACLRSDGKPADAAQCGQKPEQKRRTVSDFKGCGYYWVTSEFGEWTSNCSRNAYRARTASCMRTDNTPAEGKCTNVPQPDLVQRAEILTGCTYEWNVGEWDTQPRCSATATRTRSVGCMRTDGTFMPDDQCSGEKPKSSETLSDFSGCRFNWVSSPWTAWSSSCSDSASRARTSTCVRTDGGIYDDSFCDASTRPAETETKGVYDSCSTEWSVGEWSAYDSACSPTSKRIRSIECRQSQPSGVKSVDLSICDQAARPRSEETAERYMDCSGSWEQTPWGWNGVEGAWSSTCSNTAKQTSTASCVVRFSGGGKMTLDESKCTAPKPTTTKTEQNITGCNYDYVISAWGPFDSTCSNAATRTRTVECRYNPDNNPTVYPDSACVQAGANQGTIPLRSETRQNVTDCQGLIADPGFERNGTGWSQSGPAYSGWPLVIAYNQSHSGSYVSRAWGGQAVLRYNFTSKAGTRYRLSWWCQSAYYNNCQVKVAGTVIGTSNSTSQTIVWTQTTGTFVGTGMPMMIEVFGTGPYTVPGRSDWNATAVDDFLLVEY